MGVAGDEECAGCRLSGGERKRLAIGCELIRCGGWLQTLTSCSARMRSRSNVRHAEGAPCCRHLLLPKQMQSHSTHRTNTQTHMHAHAVPRPLCSCTHYLLHNMQARNTQHTTHNMHNYTQCMQCPLHYVPGRAHHRAGRIHERAGGGWIAFELYVGLDHL